MPKSSLQRQEFGSKKPYLVAAVFSLALILFFIYKAEVRIGDVWRDKAAEIQGPLDGLTKQDSQLQKALGDRTALKKQADDMRTLAESRFYWIGIFTDLRKVMMQAEEAEKAKLTTPDNGGTNTEEGVWVDTFSPVMPQGYESGNEASGSTASGGLRSGIRTARGGRPGGPSQPSSGVAIVVPTAGNEVAKISLICKGVNRSTAANSDLAYSVRQFMTNSPSFTNAVLEGTLVVDVDTNTFTFNMTVDLKHHFKL